MSKDAPLRTPDKRYLVIDGRLWRASNPALDEDERARLTRELMNARRAIAAARRGGDENAERTARRAVHVAKVALGERGPVWWTDGAPDENRRRIENTSYAEWWERIAHELDSHTEWRGPVRSRRRR